MVEAMQYHKIDEDFPDSFEVICAKAKPEEVLRFISGCSKVSERIKEINPDLQIFPLRGARPIEWALDVLEGDASMNKIFPRIGTHIGDVSGKQAGLDRDIKTQVIASEFDLFIKMNFIPQKPIIIDEVQTGGGIVYITKRLRRIMNKMGSDDTILYVLPVCDSKVNSRNARGYTNMVQNKYDDRVKVLDPVEVPLFATDRDPLLDILYYPEFASEEDKPMMQMVLQNTQARDIIQMLVYAYLNKESFITALEGNHQFADSNVTFVTQKLTHVLRSTSVSKNAINWIKSFAQLI